MARTPGNIGNAGPHAMKQHKGFDVRKDHASGKHAHNEPHGGPNMKGLSHSGRGHHIGHKRNESHHHFGHGHRSSHAPHGGGHYPKHGKQHGGHKGLAKGGFGHK